MRGRLVLTIAMAALVSVACAGATPSASQPESQAPVSEASSSAAASASAASGPISDDAKSVDFDWGTFTLAQRIVDKAASGAPLAIVVQNAGTAIPVYGAQQLAGVERGCEANKARLNIECRLAGPAQSDMTAQLSELETLLASDQVDCLGLAALEPNAGVDIVNKYVEAGIPVFTESVDIPSSKRFAFFALQELAAGHAAGLETANLVKAQGLEINTIAMGSGSPTGQWAQDRMQGFMDGYKEVFPDAKFAQDAKSGLPTGPNFTTQEVLDSVGPYLSGNPDVNLFFHTDQGVEGVAEVIKQKGLSGKVFTSGFNVSLPILEAIESGEILVTIDQGFDNQAEAPVKACVDFLAEGLLPEDPLAYLNPIIVTKAGGDGLMSVEDAKTKLNEALGGS